MVTTLEELYAKHGPAFQLKLVAGRPGSQDIVDWIYMLEDETILPFLHGGSLIVTTGVRQARDPGWLRGLVEELIRIHAPGLIVNVGKYIREIPADVIALCEEQKFSLIIMPWEMVITEMTQTLCMTIIQNTEDNLIHDRALHEAILHPENTEAYWKQLGVHYDMKGDFSIVTVYAKNRNGDEDDIFLLPREMEFMLERRLRSLLVPQREMRVCWFQMDRYQAVLVNHAGKDTISSIETILKDVYRGIRDRYCVRIGVGTTEQGIRGISESYRNAVTALRMAEAQDLPSVRFGDMGRYRLLLSCRNAEITRNYADEYLAPIDAMGVKSQEYLDLLDAYIRHDRSLEGTAEELFLHRNTVNYRINKLRELLGSPLKTVEDLIPYRLALDIRRITQHEE